MVTRRAMAALGVLCASLLFACGTARNPETRSSQRSLCESCHGFPPGSTQASGDVFDPSATRLDLAGDLAPTEVTHLIHTGWQRDPSGRALVPSPLRKRFQCLQCHKNVQSVDDPDHIWRDPQTRRDPVPPPAEVRFDDPASLASREAGAAPTWDAATQTCSNVYCHGARLDGQADGAAHPVRWTGGPAGQAGCGSCHGIPPSNHPATIRSATQCAGCHAAAIDANGLPNPDRHVNGTVDVVAQNENACSGCHGDRTAQNVPPGDPRSAPPGDRNGDATTPAVGAHAAHVRSPRLSNGVACRECHVVPFTVLQAGHIDAAPAEVVFGAVARTGGAAAAYAAGTRGCSSTYCHGQFPGGAGANPVTWTQGATGAACESCHAVPPPTPPHPATGTAACGVCHPGYGTAVGDRTVNRALHVNGRIDRQ